MKANKCNSDEAAVSHKDAVSDGDCAMITEHFSNVQTTQDLVDLARCLSVVCCLNLCFPLFCMSLYLFRNFGYCHIPVDDALSSFPPSWA